MDSAQRPPPDYSRAYSFPPTYAVSTNDGDLQNGLKAQAAVAARTDDRYSNWALSAEKLINKILIAHPCTVLRRQCQVHQNARRLHLNPVTLVPVVAHMVSKDGISTLWKGAFGYSILYGMNHLTEKVLSDAFGLPKAVDVNGSNDKFIKLIALKTCAAMVMTPFNISSFIETVKSSSFYESNIMSVISRGLGNLRDDFFGGNDSGRKFSVISLTAPTVTYAVSHFLISRWVYNSIYEMARKYVLKEAPKERTQFHSTLPDLFAAMTSSLAADLICYPIETVLHRMYIQGTRTLIDNLDEGISAVAASTNYNGFFDCLSSIIRNEGFMALYSGVGAIALQYSLQFCVLRGIEYIFERATQAAAANVNHPTQQTSQFAAAETPIEIAVSPPTPTKSSSFIQSSENVDALALGNLNNNLMDDEDDDDDDGMDPETVLSFITSQVKMQDPVTNKPIYPYVSIVAIPEKHFEFTSVVKVNDIHRGTLNLMFKQAAQLERMISGFTVDSLPLPTRKIVRMLQNAPELKSKEYLNILEKQLASSPALKKLATQTQLMIINFLGEYMSEDHYMGELTDNRGRTRSVWRVFTRIGSEEAMITPFGAALYKPTSEIHRSFREIASFTFAPLSDVQSKMKKTIMHGDWSSTCSSSSKLSC